MATIPAESHEAVAQPKSPEQVFVEGIIGDAMASYAYLYEDPAAVDGPGQGFMAGLKRGTKERRQEELTRLGDYMMATALLAGAYDDPVAEVARLGSSYNDYSALALYRMGHKDAAYRYLNDQLDTTKLVEPYAVLAGLGDQEAANLLPVALGENPSTADLTTTIDRVVKTAFRGNGHYTVDLLSVTGLDRTFVCTTGKRRQERGVYKGELLEILARVKYGEAHRYGAALSSRDLHELYDKSRKHLYDKERTMPAKLAELYADAVIYGGFSEEFKQTAAANFKFDVGRLSEEERALLTPPIERVLDILPYYPKAYPMAEKEYAKLSAVDKERYMPMMAVAIGLAKGFTQARLYFDRLGPADKVRAAYKIATFFHDSGVRFEMQASQDDYRGHKAGNRLGALSVAHGPDYYDPEVRERTLSEALALVDMAEQGVDGGIYVSPELQIATAKVLQLAPDRHAYGVMLSIREAEKRLAILHSCIEPGSLPRFDEWVKLRIAGDNSWIHGSDLYS